MKSKTLIPLAIILAILAGLVLLRNAQNQPVSITDEVVLQRLLPEGLTADGIDRIEVFAGADEDDKLVLARNAERERWEIVSHFNAPVKQDKIDEFLETLVGLKGESRQSGASEEALEDYDLTQTTGFHITGHAEGAEEPVFHVIAGKSPGYDTTFMRAADNQDIYVTDADLRRDAGIYSQERSEAPKANTWIDKQILTLDKDKVKRVELVYPDKEMVFEYRPKETEPPEDAGDPAEGEGEESVITPVEYEWALVSGGVGSALKESAFSSLLSKLSNLTATGVADPSKKADWKLDPPIYICRVTLDGEDAPTEVQGGRPRTSGTGYLRVATADDDVVYEMNQYGFEQLFPKGMTLFDLPGLSYKVEDITRIEYHSAEGKVVIGQKDGEWTVESPKVDLPVVESKVITLAAALAAWRAADYADSKEDTGLDEPERAVTFQTSSGETHTIEVGKASTHFEGYYAGLSGHDRVLAITESDVDKIFVPRKDLYDRSLFDLDEDEIERVEVTRGGDVYRIERVEDIWNVTAGEETTEAKQKQASDLVLALAGLEADDIAFDSKEESGAELGKVEFVMKDGTKYSIRMHAEHDGGHIATVSGKNVRFVITPGDLNEVMPALDTLREVPEEPEEAPAADAESAEAVDEAQAEAAAVEEAPANDEESAEATAEEPAPAAATETPES